jgi:hypothetical protein
MFFLLILACVKKWVDDGKRTSKKTLYTKKL